MESTWEPGGTRLSALTLQLLDSSQEQERRVAIKALKGSSAERLSVVAWTADRHHDGTARICRPEWPWSIGGLSLGPTLLRV